jgi:hypothetical protein
MLLRVTCIESTHLPPKCYLCDIILQLQETLSFVRGEVSLRRGSSTSDSFAEIDDDYNYGPSNGFMDSDYNHHH